MPGVSRVGQDTAGGVIVGILAPTVFVNGTNVSVIGDPVAGHGTGSHSSPKMAEGSSSVFAHNIGICKAGDKATCGHAATGSSDVFSS